MESDEFEDISLALVKAIVRRDTLVIPSELVVWHAVARWSHRACRRRHIVPTPENKRFLVLILHFAELPLKSATGPCWRAASTSSGSSP